MIKLAVFASGSGSNAQRIIEYFASHARIRISLIITNKQDAFVIERAKRLNVPCIYCNRSDFYETGKVLEILQKEQIDWIILAGFLWMVPIDLLQNYPNHIVNIHPALLPKYGGKGMYGMKVHEAVVAASEAQSGITIHYVNEKYDEGELIFQAHCRVDPNDTPEMLAEKIHQLEYEHFPKIIEQLIDKE